MGRASNDSGTLVLDSECSRCNDRDASLLGVAVYDVLIATGEHARFMTGASNPVVEIAPIKGQSIFLHLKTLQSILSELERAASGERPNTVQLREFEIVDRFYPQEQTK